MEAVTIPIKKKHFQTYVFWKKETKLFCNRQTPQQISTRKKSWWKVTFSDARIMLNGSPLDLAKTRRSFEKKDNLFGSFLSWWREVIFAQSERLIFLSSFFFL